VDQDDSNDLARHLFAVVTGLLEDAAALAADGQSRSDALPTSDRAGLVEATARRAIDIVRAVAKLPLD